VFWSSVLPLLLTGKLVMLYVLTESLRIPVTLPRVRLHRPAAGRCSTVISRTQYHQLHNEAMVWHNRNNHVVQLPPLAKLSDVIRRVKAFTQ